MINKTPTPRIVNERMGQPINASACLFRSKFSVWLRQWFYRCWLCVATVTLVGLLLTLQSLLDTATHQLTIWQESLRWAELIWLAPVPIALALWSGWLFFASATEQQPLPLNAPFLATRPVRLVFRFVTRGDNVEVLRDSIQAVHQAFKNYLSTSGPYRIEVISECPILLEGNDSPPNITDNVYIYVVPANYVTPQHSRFKARALTYLQECTRPFPEDWYVYLDEESMVDTSVIAGIYRFIYRALQTHTYANKSRAKKAPTGLIGQGAILYQGGHWFFRGADALRTADDLGRFRLQYALGMPLFGVHGSYLVVRGTDDPALSFDVGPANSITEDTAWALRAWAKGFRFAWVEGYLREQPPQRIMDLIKQRSRWLSGIRLVLLDRSIPLRYRCCLGLFTSLWQLAFLPFLVAVVALVIHTSPFIWMRLPADFAWATFVLAYLQGLDVLAKHETVSPHLPSSSLAQKLHTLQRRMLSWPLVLCYVWYALLEAAATLYSLKPKQGFFVIHKPSLASNTEIAEREATTASVGAKQEGRK
ncbi:hypothetical protein EPA93_21020 [Ktedonosporobacter rubrisoli]|uniref:Glycosyltransferase 2-like domain-containing protein n=1 Tax=Ktedonosporobacter rubrisoli TaxID=2509675 RepID=A0A4P6JST2_KTERU|nr:glycosyltransferase family 2 protein [Ktedonosporobacter rubrisoli]QBD78345.1 hypothetical protein EPA93_21020 [Ktedonosporobacter rubrisoli]